MRAKTARYGLKEKDKRDPIRSGPWGMEDRHNMKTARWAFVALLIAAAGTLLYLPRIPGVADAETVALASDETRSVAVSNAPETVDAERLPADNAIATDETVETRADSSNDGLISTASSGAATRTITLSGNSISTDATDASINGSTITITSAGTYTVSGVLADGQIIVDTDDSGSVRLVLDDVDVTCRTSAPIYGVNAEKLIIEMADGTVNAITDSAEYENVDATTGEPSAAIFSNDDLTISGDGTLIVTAKYNNGIQSNDDLRITGGTVVVDAVNDALKGRDSVTIRDADVTVTAGADGVQSTNTEDADRGTITIESGTLHITAELDGIQAATNLLVSGGDITIVTGGGSANSSTTSSIWGTWGREGLSTSSADTTSAKGLKATVDVTITGGTIDIDSSDDAIHSNDTLTIDAGTIAISSGDDGIHADTSLVINGGTIDIDTSYEGIESMDLSLNGGSIYVTASDDGINGAGGSDGSAVMGRPGQNMFAESTNCAMTVSGGYIYVDAIGDGLDINGPITMTGGTVVLHAPTDDRDGALDWTGSFDISGGFLIAAGSCGRTTQAPSSISAQYSVLVNLNSSVSAGTLIHIEDENGNSVATFEPTKTWQSFLLSTASLEFGETYNIYVGGSASGESTDGLYARGTYSPGTNVGSFTISSAVTILGQTTR